MKNHNENNGVNINEKGMVDEKWIEGKLMDE
jgi:hypothetical protein